MEGQGTESTPVVELDNDLFRSITAIETFMTGKDTQDQTFVVSDVARSIKMTGTIIQISQILHELRRAGLIEDVNGRYRVANNRPYQRKAPVRAN